MKARYAGTCRACGKRHILPGMEIEKMLGGVAKSTCAQEEREIRAISARVQEKMREDGIALGVWGIPAGHRPTDTRFAFYHLARERQHMTAEEYFRVEAHFIGLGIWQYALDD